MSRIELEPAPVHLSSGHGVTPGEVLHETLGEDGAGLELRADHEARPRRTASLSGCCSCRVSTSRPSGAVHACSPSTPEIARVNVVLPFAPVPLRIGTTCSPTSPVAAVPGEPLHVPGELRVAGEDRRQETVPQLRACVGVIVDWDAAGHQVAAISREQLPGAEVDRAVPAREEVRARVELFDDDGDARAGDGEHPVTPTRSRRLGVVPYTPGEVVAVPSLAYPRARSPSIVALARAPIFSLRSSPHQAPAQMNHCPVSGQ